MQFSSALSSNTQTWARDSNLGAAAPALPSRQRLSGPHTDSYPLHFMGRETHQARCSQEVARNCDHQIQCQYTAPTNNTNHKSHAITKISTSNMPALRTTVGSRWPCLCARTTCLCWPTLSYVTPSAKPCLFCQLFLSWESLGLDIEPSTRAAMSASRACKGVSTFSWSSCQQGLPACRINGRTLGAALLHSFGWSDLKHT